MPGEPVAAPGRRSGVTRSPAARLALLGVVFLAVVVALEVLVPDLAPRCATSAVSASDDPEALARDIDRSTDEVLGIPGIRNLLFHIDPDTQVVHVGFQGPAGLTDEARRWLAEHHGTTGYCVEAVQVSST